MSCDVHVHIELKIKGKWEHYATPSIERWYALFGRMAGVRDDEVEPIAQPRGLPSDITTMTRFCYEYIDGDAHTPSWLSAEEVRELEEWIADNKCGFPPPIFGYLLGNGYGDWTQYPEDYNHQCLSKRGLEDFRFVFWFDN